MLSSLIKDKAIALGFDVAGITRISSLKEGEEAIQSWVKEGRHGGMKYLEDFDARKRRFLEDIPDARSVIVLGINYYFSGDPHADPRLKISGMTGASKAGWRVTRVDGIITMSSAGSMKF